MKKKNIKNPSSPHLVDVAELQAMHCHGVNPPCRLCAEYSNAGGFSLLGPRPYREKKVKIS
jgi:hypothetical protein